MNTMKNKLKREKLLSSITMWFLSVLGICGAFSINYVFGVILTIVWFAWIHALIYFFSINHNEK